MPKKSVKVYENTLENARGITSIRRDGNSVRLVDNAIQILFSGKVCICLDHSGMGTIRHKNISLLKMVLFRLESEFDLSGKDLRVNEDKFEIELLNC